MMSATSYNFPEVSNDNQYSETSTTSRAKNTSHRSPDVMHEDSDKRTQSKNRKGSCLSRVSSAIIWSLENAFYRIGIFVGEYPVVAIVMTIVMCGLCGIGMKTFKETEVQEKLWVPQSSRIIPEKAWVDRNFPLETRYVSLLTVHPGGNVLTPKFINGLMDYYERANQIKERGRTFSDLCVRVGQTCLVPCLLELWLYNKSLIASLTPEDIIAEVNQTLVSPVSGVEIRTLLGGDITRNESGIIVSAEATQMTWTLKKEEDNSDAANWEKQVIDLVQTGHPDIEKTFVYATRSFDDEGYGAINSDIKLMSVGFTIVFAFVMLSLGKFNLIEQKIYVSISGMACVGLSILVAYGLSTAMGIIYSPIQAIMPFLLLGIGVDDMFIIVESWKHLNSDEVEMDIPKKMALTLSRAGVSITVTSITDIVAFGIGATTVIPALSSFCIYAALGIFALFVLVCTAFSGVLALDDRRRKARRDACICCIRHSPSYSPSKCSTGRSFMQAFFQRFYGPLITKLPVKIFIILLALALASLGLWRFVQMRQDFDINMYIPSDSYAYSYATSKEFYFEREGVDTSIYCGGFNYFKEQTHLHALYDHLTHSQYIQAGTINSWYTAFDSFLLQNGKNATSEEDYLHELYQFLHSPPGHRFTTFVKFNSSKEPVSILASYITMTHVNQPNSQSDVRSMDAVRDLIDNSGFPKMSGEDMPEYMCFSYTRPYLSFETNKVLLGELYRNLGLAAGAVFIVTVVLIANLWTSLMVFICVLFTVVNVGGILEVWGTTIDTASSILLTLSVGLAVDYSAHVGHTFMTVAGSRNERAVATLSSIGPPVFNGGFSTMLAFVLLADSASYGFQLFFRVFLTVVVFGLFHGLALLPAMLSLCGPPPYSHVTEDSGPPPSEGDAEKCPHLFELRTTPLQNGQAESHQFAYNGPPTNLDESTEEGDRTNNKPYVSVIRVSDLRMKAPMAGRGSSWTEGRTKF